MAADFRIALPKPKQALFGAYTTPSRLYEVDQFSLTISSAAGPLAPVAGSIDGVMTDLKGNACPIRY